MLHSSHCSTVFSIGEFLSESSIGIEAGDGVGKGKGKGIWFFGIGYLLLFGCCMWIRNLTCL